MRRAFLLLALCFSASAWGLGLPSSPPAPQPSPQNSEPPSGLWNQLLEQTQSLPGNFDSFTASLSAQVESLKNSNLLLTDKNASLMESLRLSESRAATSEAKSAQLQTDLDASMLSITKAQNEAAALGLKAARWEILGIAGLACGVGGLIFAATR